MIEQFISFHNLIYSLLYKQIMLLENGRNSMCGIAGIINFTGRLSAKNLLTQMTDVIKHCGPENSGIYISYGVAFVHRSLSIIDLAGGHQRQIKLTLFQ